MRIYCVDVKGVVHRIYSVVPTVSGISVNVSFVWQTISSLLDWKPQIWKKIKAVWPWCLLSLALCVCEGARKREGGYRTTVLCLCAKGRSRGSACPLMRTCVVFHISHPTPMGSSLVQRRALAFQIRCAIPFDNEERESNMCCCARLGQWGVGLGIKNLFWIGTVSKFLRNKDMLPNFLIPHIHSWQQSLDLLCCPVSPLIL